MLPTFLEQHSDKNSLFKSQRREGLIVLNTNLNTETDEVLVKNLYKRKTMVEDITAQIMVLKRCAQRFRQAAQLKELNSCNQQEKLLLGDLGSSLENTNFYNLNGKYQQSQNPYKQQTLFDLTVGIMKKLKLQKSQQFIDKFTQLLLTTIDPIHPFMYVWNLINILIIFFFFFSLFIEEAFTFSYLKFECKYFRELNLVALIILFLDLIFRFNVKILVRGELLDNKKEIMFHYLQNGFLYDLLALFGFFYRCQDKISFNQECVNSDLTETRWLVKYLFLFKFQRLLQLMKFFDYKFAFSPKNKRVMKLFRLFVFLMLVAHVFACAWVAVGKWSEQIYHKSWLKNFEDERMSSLDIYFKSLYFACMTMTTVGYGDILPSNKLEYILCIIMMIISSPIFGYTLNTVTNILQDIYDENEVYNNEVVTLAKYMRKKNISLALQDRVLDYLQCMQAAGLNDDQQEEARILGKLSQSLREGLLQQEKGPMLQGSTAITEGFREVFLNKIFESAQEVRFQPGEIVKPQTKGYHYMNESFIYVVRGQLDFFYENKLDKNEEKHKVKLFSLKTGERSGILNLFGKQSINDYSIVSEDFTVLYIVKLQDILNLIYSNQFINSEERIIYCQLQDKIRLYNDYKGFLLKCKICSQTGHEFQDCKNFFYSPLKPLVIARRNFSCNQARKYIERQLKISNKQRPDRKLIRFKRFLPFPPRSFLKQQQYQPIKTSYESGEKEKQDQKEQDAISNLEGEASNVRLLSFTPFNDQDQFDGQEEFINYEKEEVKDNSLTPRTSKQQMKNEKNQSKIAIFDPIQKIRVQDVLENNLKNQNIGGSNFHRNNSDICDNSPFQGFTRSVHRVMTSRQVLDSFVSPLDDFRQTFEGIKQYNNYFNTNNAQVVIRKYNMVNEVRQRLMKAKKLKTQNLKFKSKFSKKKKKKVDKKIKIEKI